MNSWQHRAVRILFFLVIVAPPLFVGLDVADCEFHMEVRTLAASQETWIRQQTDPAAWLIPTWNGAPRVNKPPLSVWLNMLIWQGLDPDSSSVDQLVHRARLFTSALSLLALAAVWGIGTILKDGRYGLLAALITGTSLLFLRYARMASYDTYLMAFSTFAVAASICAMRPDRPDGASPAQRATGWIGCGLFMALAFLSKGPIALVMTAAPIAAIIGLGPRRRANALGLGIALLLAAALVAPWYLYVLGHVPAADRIMGEEFMAHRKHFQPPWYYVILLYLVAPWCTYLAAGVVGLLRRKHDWREPRYGIPAIWFAVIFVLMSLPAAKQQRYIIPLLPAAGLIMAHLAFPGNGAWSGPGLASRALAWGLRVGSILIGALGLSHDLWVRLGALKTPIFSHLPPPLFALLAVPLFLLSGAMLRRARAGQWESAAMLAAVWMTLLATPALYDYAFSPNSRYRHRAEVESVIAVVGSAPLYHLLADEVPDYIEWPDPKMLLYGRRIIPRWDRSAPEPGAWLMAADHPSIDRRLRGAGWQMERTFHDGNTARRLYRAP